MKWIIWHISLNKSVLMRFMQQEKITNFLYRKQRMNSLSFGIFCEKWCDCSIGNGRIPHTNFRLGWQQKLPALRLLFHFQHPQKMGTCNIYSERSKTNQKIVQTKNWKKEIDLKIIKMKLKSSSLCSDAILIFFLYVWCATCCFCCWCFCASFNATLVSMILGNHIIIRLMSVKQWENILMDNYKLTLEPRSLSLTENNMSQVQKHL